MNKKPKLKSDSGPFYTRALFKEQYYKTAPEDRHPDVWPIFSLHEGDEDLINFGALYVELGDPTGYAISKEVLHSYRHWQALMKCEWFREAKKVWDEELDAKLKAEGVQTLRAVASAGNVQAAKFLATLEYKEKRGRGRPSNEDVKAELKRAAADEKELNDAIARISEGSNVVRINASA